MWRNVGSWLLIVIISVLLVFSIQLYSSISTNTAPTSKDAAHTNPVQSKKPSG